MTQRHVLRVAVITPGYPTDTSGAFQFVKTRVRQYVNRGIVVEVYVPAPRQLQVIASAIADFAPDVLAIHYPTRTILTLVSMLGHIPRVVWLHGHDVLWSWEVNAQSALDAVRRRVLSIPRQLLMRGMVREFLWNSAGIVCVSRWLREQAFKGEELRPSIVHTIPNPIDTELFKPSRSHERNPSGYAGVTVKQMNNRHGGLDIAVDAFAEPGMPRLRIIGTGRLAASLERRARRKGSNVTIEHVHIQSECLPEVFHQALFYFAPSRFETQGVAMCEAMACGLPVVGFQTGGIPEFVTTGLEGLLVRQNRVGSALVLAEAVGMLLHDSVLMSRMSTAARSRIEHTFSCDVVVPKEIDVLSAACAG
jgi:glycosyltransferase involved in cell wall biosynthesis